MILVVKMIKNDDFEDDEVHDVLGAVRAPGEGFIYQEDVPASSLQLLEVAVAIPVDQDADVLDVLRGEVVKDLTVPTSPANLGCQVSFSISGDYLLILYFA